MVPQPRIEPMPPEVEVQSLNLWTARETAKLVFILWKRIRIISSVQFSCSVVSDSFRPHGLQHTRVTCLSATPRPCSGSCLSRWCHPTISSCVVPFSSCLQSFPTSGSFPVSQFFTSGGQSIGVSALASVLPMSIQDWFPLGLTGLISLQSKGLSIIFHDKWKLYEIYNFSAYEFSLEHSYVYSFIYCLWLLLHYKSRTE